MIIDSDIFIWYFRGNARAADFLANNHPVTLSAVSYIELLQGMRNKQELSAFRKEIHNRDWKILTITPEITSRAMTYIEEYALSHAMALADSLIAATAMENGDVLATGNMKHYQFLADLDLVQFEID